MTQKAKYIRNYPSLINVSSQQFKLIISQCLQLVFPGIMIPNITQKLKVFGVLVVTCKFVQSLIYHGNQHFHLDNQVRLWDIEDLIEEEREGEPATEETEDGKLSAWRARGV